MIKDLGETKDKTMIEIGSFIGESTVIFAGHFKHVSAIDPFQSDYDPEDPTSKFNFDEVYEEYKRRIEPEKEKVTTYKLTSNDALSVLHGQKFDFIYIDGDHTAKGVYTDAHLSWDKLKPYGIMAFDDYVWQHDTKQNHLRPKPGIDKFLSEHSGEYQLLIMDEQVWISKNG
jgi:predicted O-methyltransferase YrrM